MYGWYPGYDDYSEDEFLEEEALTKARRCFHKWKRSEGFTQVYYDCSLCGSKREVVEKLSK